MCDRPVASTEINMTDCLSCSGCVSIDEASDLLHLEAIELIKKGNVNIIITPQVKMALYSSMGIKESFRKFEQYLVKYLSVDETIVIDSSIGSKLLLTQEIGKLEKNTPVISSICPGTVLYLYNTVQNIESTLSNSLSPIELAAKYVRTINQNKNISLVMCKDKRIEAKNNVHIDYSVTAKELFDSLLNKVDFYAEIPEIAQYTDFEYKYSVARILNGSTSGGIFESLAEHLSNRPKPPGAAVVTVKKQEKHNEFLIKPENKKVLQLFGSSRIIAFTTKLKKNTSILSEYLYIEMNMCLGGCLYGPSQGIIVDSTLYKEIQTDSVSQETIRIPPINGTRNFIKYKKLKERRNYLVEW